MKTYKQYLLSEVDINERTAMGWVSAAKLQKSLSKIKSTDDTNKKIDALAQSVIFALGTISLGLNKKRR